MKIQVLSDLHFEFGKWPSQIDINAVEADVTVLAGDIGVGLQGVEWALSIQRPVIYVFGNHEYYGHRTMKRVWEKALAKTQGTHIHILENQSVTLPDPGSPGTQVRFLGTTLWTDFELFGVDRRDEAMQFASTRMTDYQRIHVSNRMRVLSDGLLRQKYRYDVLTPSITRDLHREARAFLEKALAERMDPTIKTVVVTHHAPTRLSLEQGTAASMFDAAYASNLETLAVQPDLWLHGHTHVARDYSIDGQGHIVCNPRGYAGHGLVEQFQPQKVLDL